MTMLFPYGLYPEQADSVIGILYPHITVFPAANPNKFMQFWTSGRITPVFPSGPRRSFGIFHFRFLSRLMVPCIFF